MLIKTEKYSDRCAAWEDFTPNELMNSNSDYYELIRKWAAESDIPKWDKVFEVRIVNQLSELAIHRSNMWWDDPMWMDKLFWVYQKPIQLYPDGPKGEPIMFYALEFYESQRVKDAAIEKLGYNPYSRTNEHGERVVDEMPSMMVPVDSVRVEWEETSGGYADNIRERAIERSQRPLTQEEAETEAMSQEAVKELTKAIQDVSEDSRWQSPTGDKAEVQKKGI